MASATKGAFICFKCANKACEQDKELYLVSPADLSRAVCIVCNKKDAFGTPVKDWHGLEEHLENGHERCRIETSPGVLSDATPDRAETPMSEVQLPIK